MDLQTYDFITFIMAMTLGTAMGIQFYSGLDVEYIAIPFFWMLIFGVLQTIRMMLGEKIVLSR